MFSAVPLFMIDRCESTPLALGRHVRFWYQESRDSLAEMYTKLIRGMAKLDCRERLALLDAEVLEPRRLEIDLVIVFEILFGIIVINFNDYYEFKQNGSYSW